MGGVLELSSVDILLIGTCEKVLNPVCICKHYFIYINMALYSQELNAQLRTMKSKVVFSYFIL